MYSLTDHTLTIVDQDLGIHIVEPFNVPYLPDDFLAEKKTSSGEKIVLEKFADGSVERACLKKGDLFHGEYRLFYPTGELLAQMFYHANRLHGPSKYFAKNGTLLSEAWFHLGKREGVLKQYYASGALSSIQRYRNGVLEGAQEYFYENGMEKTSMAYRQGKLEGDVELFWTDGAPKRVVAFQGHKRHGWDQMWSQDGVLLDAGEYDQGNPIGTHTRRYANGMMREEIVYHSLKKMDKRAWDEKGTLLFEGIFAPNGSYTERNWNEEKKAYDERKGHWDGEKLCFS